MDSHINPRNSNEEEINKIPACNLVQNNRRRIRTLVPYFVVLFFIMIAFLDPLEQILVSGLLLITGYIIYAIVIPTTIVTIFHMSQQDKKITIFCLFLLLLIYLLGLFSIIVDIWISNNFLRRMRLILPPLIISLGIVGNLIYIHFRKGSNRNSMAYLIVLLSMAWIMVVPLSLNLALTYIYSPPALTSDSMSIYKTCINFLKRHNDLEYFRLHRNGWVSLGDNTNKTAEAYFTVREIDEIIQLREKLYAIGCQQLEKDDDIVLFYKNANNILPVGPGVLCSLKGQNPNEIENEALKASKPFIEIAGNWYMSRNLLLKGPRANTQTSIPKALFDHSLHIDGIDPNEVNKFD